MRLFEITGVGRPAYALVYIEYMTDEDEDEGMAIIKINDVTDEQLLFLMNEVSRQSETMIDFGTESADQLVDVPGTLMTGQVVEISRNPNFKDHYRELFDTYKDIDVNWLVTMSPDLAKIPEFNKFGTEYNYDYKTNQMSTRQRGDNPEPKIQPPSIDKKRLN